MWFDADSSPQFDNQAFGLKQPEFEAAALLGIPVWHDFPGAEADVGAARYGFRGLEVWGDGEDAVQVGRPLSPLPEIFSNPVETASPKDGFATSYEEDIVVVGYRQVGYDLLYPWWNNSYWTIEMDGGGGGGFAFEPEPTSETEDCQKDGVATEVTDTINTDTQDGNERAALIYRDANGNIVSTPVTVGVPGEVAVPLPAGVSMSQVIGFIHSHPTAPTTGDTAVDALYNAADVYPSPADWDQMDAMVAGGANPDTLSFYVIDMHGAVREYNYSDKAIYDVPAEQLLGTDGTPPPVPEPMSHESDCGG